MACICRIGTVEDWGEKGGGGGAGARRPDLGGGGGGRQVVKNGGGGEVQSLGLMTTDGGQSKPRGGRLEVGRGGSEEGRLPHTSVPALLSARPPPVAWRHLLPMPKRETRGDSLFSPVPVYV